MKKPGVFFLAAILSALFIPSVVFAAYVYPGSAVLQPLAVIEPSTPDGLFHSWTGEIDRAGRSNLGITLDFLRNEENSDDWDEILSVTGSFRRGNKLLFGFTIPYIVRDPEFNESDLLDLRAFARMRLVGSSPGFGISGELSASVPTAKEGDLYPFTLDSPVVGVRLAFFGGAGETRVGAAFGYQSYLESETGDDADLLYNLWFEKRLNTPWSLIAEYSGSKHNHSGPPGDDEVSDGHVLIGLRSAYSSRTNFGIGVGTGVGGDSFADILVTAKATVRFGAVEGKKRERKVGKKKAAAKPETVALTPAAKKPEAAVPAPAVKKPALVAPAPGSITVVMIAEGVAGGDTEKRITRALQQKGYATGKDPKPGIKSSGRNVLYYMPGMQEKALGVSRTLISGGHLKDLRVEESKVALPVNWLLLMLGGEKR